MFLIKINGFEWSRFITVTIIIYSFKLSQSTTSSGTKKKFQDVVYIGEYKIKVKFTKEYIMTNKKGVSKKWIECVWKIL